MKIEYMKLDKIRPYPGNAKKHKIAWIKKSIETFKFDQPIVVDEDYVIIKGHGRYEAAKQLEMEKVPVIRRKDLNKEAAAMSRLADNRAQQGGGFDFGKLKKELSFLNKKFDNKFMDAIGFKPSFLRKAASEDIGIDFEEDESEIDSEPIENEPSKHALSIVLNDSGYTKWLSYKEKCKKKTDTTAFLNLLETIDD